MTDRHVLDRLPLWIAGDLDAPETEAVQTHLDQCPDCRIAADRLRESRAWLRETLAPPFGAEDHTHLREAILAQVRQAEPPRRTSRLRSRTTLLATAAAALLLLALADLWRHPPAVPPSPALPAPAGTFVPAPQATARTAPSQPAPLRLARARPAPREAPNGDSGPARIEFQTSDPTVRIIWLARAMPSPDPNPSLPEEP